MTIKSAVKKFLDWSILLLWLLAGCVIFLFTANMQDPAVGPLLMLFVAIGPIAACLIALHHRKRAAQVFLVNGALATCLLIFLELLEWANDDHFLRSLLSIFGFITVFFVAPALYWLITARRQWPPYIQNSFSRWTKLVCWICAFLVLFGGSVLMGLYQIP